MFTFIFTFLYLFLEFKYRKKNIFIFTFVFIWELVLNAKFEYKIYPYMVGTVGLLFPILGKKHIFHWSRTYQLVNYSRFQQYNKNVIVSIFIESCRGHFSNKGQKCDISPNLPLGSLEVFIVENQAQNSKCIMNKRLMIF